ncbi:MAG: hydrogenase expression/formation protein HypE [Wenzhouxiangellaceae bacterium]|nr:hydrogenase expression/formation protein HypE [Wenzhouxiangellaceae bacterium]
MTFKPEKYIRLAHGNGGRYMRELIEHLFAARLGGQGLDTRLDAAPIEVPDGQRLMMTTDGFTVDPLEFPGGNIGSLAIHGTVNDLAVAGATPLYLTLNAFIEEGTEMALLERIVDALAAAADEAGVKVVAGDTKVLGKGQCGGVYLATTGIGAVDPGLELGQHRVRPSDRILVSGSVGDHGTAVLLAREQYGLRGDLASDSASVHPVTRTLLEFPGLRFMRDPTRGGLATVALDLARETGHGIALDEAAIPLSEPVRAVCELLGYDPLYLACEGRVVAVVDAGEAESAVAELRTSGAAPGAAIIGTVDEGLPRVTLTTALGGQRLVDELEDDPLPRIC